MTSPGGLQRHPFLSGAPPCPVTAPGARKQKSGEEKRAGHGKHTNRYHSLAGNTVGRHKRSQSRAKVSQKNRTWRSQSGAGGSPFTLASGDRPYGEREKGPPSPLFFLRLLRLSCSPSPSGFVFLLGQEKAPFDSVPQTSADRARGSSPYLLALRR